MKWNPNGNFATTWTPEQDAILRADWENGVPSPETAEKLGTSKNAVLGRAHRLDLGPHPSVTKTLWSAKEDEVLLRGRDDEGMAFADIGLLIGRTEHACEHRYAGIKSGKYGAVEQPGLPLAYTSMKGCRFAVSPHDAKPGEHRFCNEPVIDGTSWRPAHAKKVGMTQKDLDRLNEKTDRVRAHADARRARTMVDFAPHYVARNRGNGVAA